MPFSPRIANMTDPTLVERDVVAPNADVATVILDGTIDRAACRLVADECARLFAVGADTVVIEMDDDRFSDDAVRRLFVDDVVAARTTTRHLHVHATGANLHARLAAFADSGNWLLPFAGSSADTPRRSVVGEVPPVAPRRVV